MDSNLTGSGAEKEAPQSPSYVSLYSEDWDEFLQFPDDTPQNVEDVQMIEDVEDVEEVEDITSTVSPECVRSDTTTTTGAVTTTDFSLNGLFSMPDDLDNGFLATLSSEMGTQPQLLTNNSLSNSEHMPFPSLPISEAALPTQTSGLEYRGMDFAGAGHNDAAMTTFNSTSVWDQPAATTPSATGPYGYQLSVSAAAFPTFPLITSTRLPLVQSTFPAFTFPTHTAPSADYQPGDGSSGISGMLATPTGTAHESAAVSTQPVASSDLLSPFALGGDNNFMVSTGSTTALAMPAPSWPTGFVQNGLQGQLPMGQQVSGYAPGNQSLAAAVGTSQQFRSVPYPGWPNDPLDMPQPAAALVSAPPSFPQSGPSTALTTTPAGRSNVLFLDQKAEEVARNYVYRGSGSLRKLLKPGAFEWRKKRTAKKEKKRKTDEPQGGTNMTQAHTQVHAATAGPATAGPATTKQKILEQQRNRLAEKMKQESAAAAAPRATAKSAARTEGAPRATAKSAARTEGAPQATAKRAARTEGAPQATAKRAARTQGAIRAAAKRAARSKK